jgi:Zn-finger nucleic acid-binding protein
MERLTALTGVDLTICPRCRGPMTRRPLADDPLQVARATSSSPPAFADSS